MGVTDGFTMPTELAVQEDTATPTYANFIAEPLEKGFGHTLGNALRRVLLSSMEGVAVTSIRVEGVPHEFTTIPSVLEDVTEIVLNIKKLHVRCDGDLPRVLELTVNTKGEITAGAITEDGVTDVLNKDQLICTLDSDREVRMEIEIDKGRGYRAAEENKRDDQPIGVIPVDSLFSPVERVRYDVQSCRVGQRTDYDRLELEVWTDGRIDPQDAVRDAALLLREHLAVFIARGGEEPGLAEITDPADQQLLDQLLTNVNELELSVRAKNCLNNAQIRTLGQLVTKSESEMLKFRNFGKKSLEEIKVKLGEHELALGMAVKEEVLAVMEEKLSAE